MRKNKIDELLKSIREYELSLKKKTQMNISITDDETIIYEGSTKRIYKPSKTGGIFHGDNSFIRLVRGPYGSGKSTMCVHEIIRRAAAMPVWYNGRRRSRWAIVRNTSGELQSTTLQTWLSWFGQLGDIKKRQKPLMTYEHTFSDGNGIIELELIFIALDREEDIRKIKSLEVTGAYINELSEVPQGALSHFKGRVNHRYPSKSFCPDPYWSGIIADTNPPDVDHWIYKDFEIKILDSYKMFSQPPGLIKDKDDKWKQNVNCDNHDNLSYDYYTKLAEGQTEDFVKVFCLGEYGSVGFGKKVYPEFNSDLHVVDAINAIQGDPIHLGWDFGLCYSSDTEVLTKDGWKFFKDVDEKLDLVATRNPETKAFEYTKINFKTEYDWDDNLLEWSSSEVDFCVTPEHQIPFTYRENPDKVHFQSAEWLNENFRKNVYVDLCSEWNPYFDSSVRYFGMDATTYAEFMGLYLSKGTTYKQENSFMIIIYSKNQNSHIKDIIDKTGLKWNQFKTHYSITNYEIGSYLNSLGSFLTDKYVPQEIKDMPTDQIIAFIYAYTIGGGYMNTRSNGCLEHTIWTRSCKIKDDFQELSQKSGWNSSSKLNNGKWIVTFKKRAKRAQLSRKNFRRIPYQGKIYCLNVPYNTLYVRRNGRPSWNGNTPSCVVVQLSPRGQLMVLKEYTSENMGIRTFAQSVVLAQIGTDFPYNRIGESEADPSGIAGDVIMEELSCIGELNSLGIKTNPANTNNIDTRIGSVRFFLNILIDGKPGFIMSRKNCPTLFRGFSKDYCYKRVAVAGEERYRDKPDKNMSSHPMDALGYIAMRFAANVIRGKDPTPPVNMFNPTFRWQN